MGHHIILAFLEKHPTNSRSELINMYTYFKFKAYLQTSMRFTRKAFCIKLYKADGLTSVLPPDEICKLCDSQITSYSFESQYDLEGAIERLDPAQADVIKQYYYDEKTDLEISQIRQVSRQAVNSLKHRALRNLACLLSKPL